MVTRMPASKSFFAELLCRVKRVRWLRFALDVARRADLQGDAVVPYPLPELGRIVEMMSVSDPFCAEIKSILYGVRPLGISRMAREGDVQLPCQIEHRVEAAQRDDAFSPCQVTPDHAFSEELLRQAHGLEIFGHVQRFLADAHGTKQDPRLQRGMLLQPGLLPCQYSLHGVTLCKPAAQMVPSPARGFLSSAAAAKAVQTAPGIR